MRQKELVPKRRFAGFTSDWKKKMIVDISDCFSGGTPSAGNKQFYGGNISFIRSGEINAEKTELFITDEGLKNSSAKLVEKDDVLYALYGATSGEVGLSKINGAINQAVLAIKPKHDYNSYFMTQWLRKQKEFITEKYLQGGQGNLSGNIVKQLMIDLPENKMEQKKIGKFFKHLDEMIALQQRKMAKTKALKSAYLAEMFPAEGERVPKRRFEGFTDDWKEWKVSEIGNSYYGGGTPKTSENEYWGGNIPWIQSSDIDEGILHVCEPKSNITEEGLKNSAAKLIPANTIAIITRVGVGKLALIPYCYSTSQDFLSIGDLNIDSQFGTYVVYKLLENEKSAVQGTSIKGLTKDSLLSMKVLVTNERKEQQKIGAFFKKIDNTITNYQKKLAKLKATKQAYLHEMFV